MAIVKRRYKLEGPDNELLARKVHNTAKRAGQFCTPAFDVEVDDAIDGVLDALDEFMASQGFVHDEDAFTVPHLVSPGGKTFELVVDDAGSLSTKDVTV